MGGEKTTVLSPEQWRRAVPLTLVSLVHVKTSPPSDDTLFLFGGLRTGHRSSFLRRRQTGAQTRQRQKGGDSAAAAVFILQMCICLHSEHQNGAESV